VKQTIKRSIDAIVRLRKSRPKEFDWSIYGIGTGVLAGALIGGVGIAALGGAVGISASTIMGFIGGMIGNRAGVEKDNGARSQAGQPSKST
jgi:uncharacterized protein YcfJ